MSSRKLHFGDHALDVVTINGAAWLIDTQVRQALGLKFTQGRRAASCNRSVSSEHSMVVRIPTSRGPRARCIVSLRGAHQLARASVSIHAPAMCEWLTDLIMAEEVA